MSLGFILLAGSFILFHFLASDFAYIVFFILSFLSFSWIQKEKKYFYSFYIIFTLKEELFNVKLSLSPKRSPFNVVNVFIKKSRV